MSSPVNMTPAHLIDLEVVPETPTVPEPTEVKRKRKRKGKRKEGKKDGEKEGGKERGEETEEG